MSHSIPSSTRTRTKTFTEFDLQAYSVEEIVAEKLRAVYQRGAARDYYNLYEPL
jgi:predicted nucleotidyltransferase component of viral defense system